MTLLDVGVDVGAFLCHSVIVRMCGLDFHGGFDVFPFSFFSKTNSHPSRTHRGYEQGKPLSDVNHIMKASVAHWLKKKKRIALYVYKTSPTGVMKYKIIHSCDKHKKFNV